MAALPETISRPTGTVPARVLTLNLWGRSGDWSRRRAVLHDGLRELDADLIAFQEASSGGDFGVNRPAKRAHLRRGLRGTAERIAVCACCHSFAGTRGLRLKSRRSDWNPADEVRLSA